MGYVHLTRRLCAVALLALTVAQSGCGTDGSADTDGPTVTLRVTRDFGRHLLAEHAGVPLAGHRTVLRLLRAHHDLDTKFGNRSIEAIDGLRRIPTGPNARTWALLVNGIEADVFAPEYRLFDGDVVQYDLRRWEDVLGTRATIGAFPESFTRGENGQPPGVSIRCMDNRSASCRTVTEALQEAGTTAVVPARPAGDPRIRVRRARILVGVWNTIRHLPVPRQIAGGPLVSGVFARFERGGRHVRTFDWNGVPATALAASTGLVAALRYPENALAWVVSGTDELGADRAARALVEGRLRDAFAAAVTAGGPLKLPVPPR